MNSFLIIIIFIGIYFVFSRLIGVAILNIVGVPGSLIGLKTKRRTEIRYIVGLIVTVVVHLFFYFAFMIYVIEWGRINIISEGWKKYILWFFCMGAAVGSIQRMHKVGLKEFKEEKTEYLNVQVDSLLIVEVVSFFIFFLFIFYPEIEDPLWTWVKNIGYPF